MLSSTQTPTNAAVSLKCGAIDIGTAFSVHDATGQMVAFGTVKSIRYQMDWTISAIVDQTGRAFPVAAGETLDIGHPVLTRASIGEGQSLVFRSPRLLS